MPGPSAPRDALGVTVRRRRSRGGRSVARDAPTGDGQESTLGDRPPYLPGTGMRVRTSQLHYFVVIAEEGQVTRAARRLNVAQPALSQAVSQLERQLGFTLFERHARGVTLTTAAREFLP